MRLKSVNVQNYRSVIDSNLVKIDPEITNIVGMTGSGKTSFLKMLSGVDETITFPESELPNGSQTQQDFHDGKIEPNDIVQLVVVFEVEENDRVSLPEKYRDTDEIRFERRFGGQVYVTPKESDVEKINLNEQLEKINTIIETLKTNFTNSVARGVANLPQHKDNFDSAVENFLTTQFSDLAEFDLSTDSLRNTLNSIPADGPLKTEFDTRVNEIVVIRSEIQQRIEDDPIQQVYDLLPKPFYKQFTCSPVIRFQNHDSCYVG